MKKITQDELRAFEPSIIDDLNIGGRLKVFSTQKDCKQYATSIGWGQSNIIKVEKRFERIYVVAAYCEHENGDHKIIFPTGIYDIGDFQEKRMRTINILRKGN